MTKSSALRVRLARPPMRQHEAAHGQSGRLTLQRVRGIAWQVDCSNKWRHLKQPRGKPEGLKQGKAETGRPGARSETAADKERMREREQAKRETEQAQEKHRDEMQRAAAKVAGHPSAPIDWQTFGLFVGGEGGAEEDAGAGAGAAGGEAAVAADHILTGQDQVLVMHARKQLAKKLLRVRACDVLVCERHHDRWPLPSGILKLPECPGAKCHRFETDALCMSGTRNGGPCPRCSNCLDRFIGLIPRLPSCMPSLQPLPWWVLHCSHFLDAETPKLCTKTGEESTAVLA